MCIRDRYTYETITTPATTVLVSYSVDASGKIRVDVHLSLIHILAKYSKEAGYSVDGSGSSWTLISEGCRHYGVKAKTVALAESRMKAELDEGHPIVVNVGPGDFTDTGPVSYTHLFPYGLSPESFVENICMS